MDQKAILALTEKLNEKKIQFLLNEEMKNHTSFKIGGPADVLLTVNNTDDLIYVVSLCKGLEIPFMILGNGSNMLVHDKGIEGAVISLKDEFEKICLDGETIISGSAVKLEDLCIFAKEHSLSGLEFAYGIPGSVGGAAFMNAGAYDGEMKDVILKVKYLDINDLKIKEYQKEQLSFGYRKSIFRETKDIIISVVYQLYAGDKIQIEEKMNDLLGRRKSKQPLEFPSAGSVFKRPEGYFAGTLIQQCGLKGCTVGGAQVSEKHSGFIINVGDATCEDVLNLVKKIQDTVKEKTGQFLEREIIDLGR